MSERWVYLNGNICLQRDASIPISDHGFLFGEGIFTTIRVYAGTCEFLTAHQQRLTFQAGALGFDYKPMALQSLHELIKINEAQTGIWRLKIILTVKHEQETTVQGIALATLEPFLRLPWQPCRLCVFPHPFERPTAELKSLSYLDHLQVRQHARRLSCDDAVTTNTRGFILETGHSNIFWIDRGVLMIPDPVLPYLKGIFLQALLRNLKIPFQPVKATFEQIPKDASVYVCNSLTHIRPVLKIDSELFQRNPEWELLLQNSIDEAIKQN